jgi:hypothetical protein
MNSVEKNIKDALSKLPNDYKELVRKRGDLQVAINDAREWGDDTSALREKMREINEQISNYELND